MNLFSVKARPSVRIALAVAAAVALASGASGARADEAQARDLLKAMTDYLAAQQSLSFDFDSTLDIVTTDNQKLAITSSGSVAMVRPDKLHATRRGGFATVDVIFDGQTLSVLNREANLFAQAAIPGSVDHLIDRLRDDFQRPLPAADLLTADAGAVLLADATDVKDLGSGVIRGVECDHIAVRTPETDWQVWIAQGEVPHPCRFVITTASVTGWPEYTLDFSAWGAGSAAAEFNFAAPDGASKADIKDIPDLDDIAGIYATTGAN